MGSRLHPLHAGVPLDRFNSYTIHASRGAEANVESVFPDLRDFRFEGPDQPYLRSNSVTLEGSRIGTVVSSGHRIVLNDESRFALLMPFHGRIRVERRGRHQEARPSELICVAQGERCTQVAAGYRGAVILLPRQRLLRRMEMLSLDGALTLPDGFHGELVDPDFRQALRRHVAFLLDELDQSDVYLNSRTLAQGMLATISDLVVEAWALHRHDEPAGRSPRPASRLQVEKAEEFIRAMAGEPVSVGEVAAYLGIGARSLQLAFRKLRGKTPRQYLLEQRLSLLHERLCRPQSGDTVTSICHDCGIANPGRFAAQYRAAFGEQPSDTLRRALQR